MNENNFFIFFKFLLLISFIKLFISGVKQITAENVKNP